MALLTKQVSRPVKIQVNEEINEHNVKQFMTHMYSLVDAACDAHEVEDVKNEPTSSYELTSSHELVSHVIDAIWCNREKKARQKHMGGRERRDSRNCLTHEDKTYIVKHARCGC